LLKEIMVARLGRKRFNLRITTALTIAVGISASVFIAIQALVFLLHTSGYDFLSTAAHAGRGFYVVVPAALSIIAGCLVSLFWLGLKKVSPVQRDSPVVADRAGPPPLNISEGLHRFHEGILWNYLKTVPDGILLIDSNECIVNANEAICQLTGVSFQEMKEKEDPFFFLAEDGREEVYGFLDSLSTVDGPESCLIESDLAVANQNLEEKVLVGLYVQENPELSGLAVVVIPHGRSEKLFGSNKRVENSKAVGNFSAGVAHSINNLLSSIMGSVSVLESSIDTISAGKRDKLLMIIRRSTKEATSIAESLLQFGRAVQGRSSSGPVQIVQIIEEAISIIKTMPGVQSYEFCFTASGPVTAISDPGGLQQVLLNILTNAVDSMPEPGEIYIRITRGKSSGDDVVCIEVEDSGVGIDAEIQNKIFDPFFSTKSPSKMQKYLGGSGIGLSTALALVESWGGQISCRSEKGVGTVITVSLLPCPVVDVKSSSSELTVN
jgi:signal transduction histidine kinase